MEAIWQKISGFLKMHHNLDISNFEPTFFEKSIRNRMAENACPDPESYLVKLRTNSGEASALIETLGISYSKFFRNPYTFSVLENVILPLIYDRKKNNIYKEIRVWSSACAGGHEAYSLAMLLEELCLKTNHSVEYRIFASDQNERLIEQAMLGRYTLQDVDNLSLRRIHTWFSVNNGVYEVKAALKRQIEFSCFNLFSVRPAIPPTSIFGDFDLVMCANLLYYYRTISQKTIIDKLNHALAHEGFFITDETEVDSMTGQGFTEAVPGSAIFYKKLRTDEP